MADTKDAVAQIDARIAKTLSAPNWHPKLGERALLYLGLPALLLLMLLPDLMVSSHRCPVDLIDFGPPPLEGISGQCSRLPCP